MVFVEKSSNHERTSDETKTLAFKFRTPALNMFSSHHPVFVIPDGCKLGADVPFLLNPSTRTYCGDFKALWRLVTTYCGMLIFRLFTRNNMTLSFKAALEKGRRS